MPEFWKFVNVDHIQIWQVPASATPEHTTAFDVVMSLVPDDGAEFVADHWSSTPVGAVPDCREIPRPQLPGPLFVNVTIGVPEDSPVGMSGPSVPVAGAQEICVCPPPRATVGGLEQPDTITSSIPTAVHAVAVCVTEVVTDVALAAVLSTYP